MIDVGKAVIALTLAGLLWWKTGGGKWVTKAMMVLAMFAAANLTAGLVGSLAHWAATNAIAFVTWATAGLFGTAVPAVLLLVTAFVVVWDLWPKHKPTRTGVVAAALLPLILTAPAVAAGPAGQYVMTGVTAANSATGNLLGSAFDQRHQAADEAKDKAKKPATPAPAGGHR